MSFAQENGYTPRSFQELINSLRLDLNEELGTNYTETSFVGTNWYKYFYFLVQKVQENEIKTSEIFLKYRQYIALTNERIQRPSVSLPGLIEAYESRGYVVSVKKIVIEDRGQISICVLLDDGADDYAEKKLEVCQLLSQFTVGGIWSNGTEEETITLSNGQSFVYKFYLPNKIPILLRLTLNTSENSLVTPPNIDEIRSQVYNQINSRYRLGWNFEPQRYFNHADAPWASDILLEYSEDAGSSWDSVVSVLDFDDLYTFNLEDISIEVDPI